MTLTLDIRTMAFITIVFGVMYGLGFLILDRVQQRFIGFFHIGLGQLTIALGFLLIFLRALIPDALSIIAANSLLVLGFGLIFRGILRFQAQPARSALIVLPLLAVVITVFHYTTYMSPDVNLRIFTLSLILTLQTLLCGLAVLRQTPRPMLVAHVMTAIPFFLFALYSAFRAFWVLQEQKLGSFLSAGLVHGGAFLFMDLVLFLPSFGMIWIAGARLERELFLQARLDPLTSVYNRLALGEITEREVARARRHDLQMSVLLGDLDHFKQINDNHGHPFGDEVLIKVAELFLGNLRKQDILARIGGEEFIIILPDTTREQAITVAEKLRKSVEESHFVHDRKPVSVTASFGSFTSQGKGIDWEEMVSRADEALYQAKETGRNKVVSA